MEHYFSQIRQASQANLYFLALSGALIIPDICSSMDSDDGRTDSAKYISWFNENVRAGNTLMNFTGEDCWGLRCALLHQGRLEPHRGTYSRVLFIEPGVSTNVFHDNVINDALNIDVKIFVEQVVAAAEHWHMIAKDSEVYKNNYPHFMQKYPNGLPPYVGGVSVIA